MSAPADTTFVTPIRYERMRFGGDDALDFLHTLTTNDLTPLQTPGSSRLTGYCTPQGRLLGLLRVWRCNDALCARVPAGVAETLLPRLQMFVLRSRVEIAGPAPDHAFVALAGPEAARTLERADLPVPAQADTCAPAADVTVLRTAEDGFEIVAAADRSRELVRELAQAGASRADPGAWERHEIQRALPEIYPATMDQFIPQMLNLDRLGVVSFTKGCYPGQEIIARIHSRGAVKRHMYTVRARCAEAVEPGADIVDAEGQNAGTVVRTAPGADGGDQLLLAVITDAVVTGDLFLPGDVPLTVVPDDGAS